MVQPRDEGRPRRRITAVSRVIAVLLLFVCGCGGGQSQTKVNVFGTVESGPTPGPCIVGIPCSRPAAGVKLVFSRGDASFKAMSDRQGHYRLRLEPGKYKILLPGPPGPARLFPDHFVAPADHGQRVDFSIDTGVR
jgi:hypothetical protein